METPPLAREEPPEDRSEPAAPPSAAAAPAEILAQPLTLFTRTCSVEIPGVQFNEEHIDYETLVLTPDVLAVNSNYGHVAREGHEKYLKRPKKPVIRPGRRVPPKQGDGSCFCSCVSITCRAPPGVPAAKKMYTSKLFRNGSAQIYGVIDREQGDGVAVLQMLVDFVAANPAFAAPPRPPRRKAVVKDGVLLPSDKWTTWRTEVDNAGAPATVVLPIAPTRVVRGAPAAAEETAAGPLPELASDTESDCSDADAAECAAAESAAPPPPAAAPPRPAAAPDPPAAKLEAAAPRPLPQFAPPVIQNYKSVLAMPPRGVIRLEVLLAGIIRLNDAGATHFPIGICTIMSKRTPKLRFSLLLPVDPAAPARKRGKKRNNEPAATNSVLINVYKTGKINVLGITPATAPQLDAIAAATCHIFRQLWAEVIVTPPKPDAVA